MATYTWVDLDIPEAEILADLNGVSFDLSSTRELANMLKAEMAMELPNWQLFDPLSTAIAIRYSRSFVSGVRARLSNADLEILSDVQRSAHERLRLFRDKHIAHSVNTFEDNQPRANYCRERVGEEGITSISCSHSRVTGLSLQDIDDVIELTTVILNRIDCRMTQEKERLLKIVRNMPIATVLGGQQKGFVVNTRARIDKSRKR